VKIKRLEISGFKSFGSRKIFEFGDGISAIVGPNGSGKSNIADAIRWVLGEQKNRRLRVSKSEDLIFHGTNKIPKSSMAEVSILFDNNKGIFPISSAEVEISRNLLRSGESEYKLNGKKIRLLQLDELLAKSGFGTDSYTVVGQGSIDKLITSSGADRKRLFDEASGIRQYDIQYRNTQQKLNKALQNSDRIKGLLKEITPIAEALRTQTAGTDSLPALLEELNQLRVGYITSQSEKINKLLNDNYIKSESYRSRILEIEKALDIIRENSNLGNVQNNENISEDLKSLELDRDNLNQKVLLLKSEQSVLEAKVGLITSTQKNNTSKNGLNERLKRELSELVKVKNKHIQLTEKNDKEINAIEEVLLELTRNLSSMRDKLSRNQRSEYLNHANGIVQMIRTQLRQSNSKKDLDTSLKKLSDILEIAQQEDFEEIAFNVIDLQNKIGRHMSKREDVVDRQTQEVIRLRSIELDISSIEKRILEINSKEIDELEELALQNKQLDRYNKGIHTLQLKIAGLDEEINIKRDELRSMDNIISGDTQTNILRDVERLVTDKSEAEFMLAKNEEERKDFEKSIEELTSNSIDWFGGKKIDSVIKGRVVNKSELDILINKIEALKSINPQLIEESKQASERVEFLMQQEHDLGSAIQDASKLLEKLQSDIGYKFDKSFANLNKLFSKYFEKLFPNGRADISLSSDDNNDYGIEIYANPGGKRNKSIDLLSGGEKAMASVALIAAILYCNPTPFIVLDEVDAALDDENSTKFCDILKELAIKSQVIIITHNHETMQAASNLYGITAGAKGDSEVLQIALEQANELVKS